METRASAQIERVAIVGAGLAGLALTLALRRRGLSPEIVERRDGRSEPGAGIYLVGNAVRALASLGVTDPTERGGAVIRTQCFMNHRGRKLFEIDVESYWRRCEPCVCVRRSDLVAVLLDAIASPARPAGDLGTRGEESPCNLAAVAGEAYCYCDASVPEPTEDPPAGRVERLRARLRDYADPARTILWKNAVTGSRAVILIIGIG